MIYVTLIKGVQNVAIRRSPFQLGIDDRGDNVTFISAEVRQIDVRLGEVCHVEERPAEACPAEVRPHEVRPDEVCPEETRLAEVRPDEVRPDEVRLAEVRPDEARLAEVRSALTTLSVVGIARPVPSLRPEGTM